MRPIIVNKTQKGDTETYHVSGPLNEDATVVLTPLRASLGKKVIFNLKNIDYINSSGVRVWVLFLRDIRKGREIFYEECSPAIVGQLNIVSSMIEYVQVLSVRVPLQCPACRTERLDLAVAGAFPMATAQLKADVCPRCGEKMEPAEPLDEYFEFAAIRL